MPRFAPFFTSTRFRGYTALSFLLLCALFFTSVVTKLVLDMVQGRSIGGTPAGQGGGVVLLVLFAFGTLLAWLSVYRCVCDTREGGISVDDVSASDR